MSAKIFIGLVFVLLFGVAIINAQEFTFTTTAANTVASKSTIDRPELNNNAQAIIVATPLDDPATFNPHPIGVWYYNDKWNIFNSDHASMPLGIKFKLQVFSRPAVNQFLHTVGGASFGNVRSYIDNPAASGNPNVNIKILQNYAPDYRSPYKLNSIEARVEYDTTVGKWFIQNVNGSPLYPNTAYNIVITTGGALVTNTNTTVVNTGPKDPKAILPDPIAGGDLSGTYPNPTVRKILGRPLSSTAPQIGQILKWTGTEWAPADNADIPRYNAGAGLSLNGATFSAQNTAAMWNANQLASRNIAVTAPSAGQFLKWNGSEWIPSNPPDASTIPAASLIQTFFKPVLSSERPQLSPKVNFGNTYTITELSHTIVLTKRARLVINAMTDVNGLRCDLFCNASEGQFVVKINGIIEMSIRASAAMNSSTSATIGNFMIDREPGTYNIEFAIVHSPPTPAIEVSGRHSSIMVIPLE